MNEVTVAIATAMATAILYFSGFIYANAYYQYFGVSVFELGIGVQDMLSYSLPAFRIWFSHFWSELIVVASVIALAVFGARYFELSVRRTTVIAASVLGTVPAFLAISFIANFSGIRGAEADLYNLPILQLSSKTNEVDPWFGSVDLRFLAATENVIFAVKYQGTNFWTYRVPVDEVSYGRSFIEKTP